MKLRSGTIYGSRPNSKALREEALRIINQARAYIHELRAENIRLTELAKQRRPCMSPDCIYRQNRSAQPNQPATEE